MTYIIELHIAIFLLNYLFLSYMVVKFKQVNFKPLLYNSFLVLIQYNFEKLMLTKK
jgi:hypothetical protein